MDTEEYHDGYAAGDNGEPPQPPALGTFAYDEYMEGYSDGVEARGHYPSL